MRTITISAYIKPRQQNHQLVNGSPTHRHNAGTNPDHDASTNMNGTGGRGTVQGKDSKGTVEMTGHGRGR